MTMSFEGSCKSFVSKLEPICLSSGPGSRGDQSLPTTQASAAEVESSTPHVVPVLMLDPELCFALDPTALAADLRSIRNACASGADGADAALAVVRSNIIAYIASYACAISRYQLMASITADTTPAAELDAAEEEEAKVALRQRATVVLIGAQVMSNVIVAVKDPSVCKVIWSAVYPEALSSMLDIGTRLSSRNTVAATIALLTNIFTFESEADDVSHMRQFVTNRSLLVKLLWAIPSQDAMKASASIASTTTAAIATSDPVLEWFHILLYRVALRFSLHDLFTTLNPRASNTSVWASDTDTAIETEASHFTHEQLVLLHGIQGCFEDRDLVKSMNALPNDRNPIEDIQILLCYLSATTLRRLSQFVSIAELPRSIDDSIAFIKALRGKSEADWDAFVQDFPLHLVMSVVSYGLAFSIDLTSHEPSIAQCKSALVDSGLVALCVSIVATKPPMEVLSKRMKEAADAGAPTSERGMVSKEALSCLANLLYKCLPAQVIHAYIDVAVFNPILIVRYLLCYFLAF